MFILLARVSFTRNIFKKSPSTSVCLGAVGDVGEQETV